MWTTLKVEFACVCTFGVGWGYEQNNRIHPKEILLIAHTRSTLHTRRKNQMCISTGRYVTCKGLSTARCSKDESLRTNSFFPSLWRGRSYNKRTLWANFDGSFCHQSFRNFFLFAKLGLLFWFLFVVQEWYWINERKHTGWQWSRVSILAWCPSLQLTKRATLHSKGFQSCESNNVIFCHCHIVLLELFASGQKGHCLFFIQKIA